MGASWGCSGTSFWSVLPRFYHQFSNMRVLRAALGAAVGKREEKESPRAPKWFPWRSQGAPRELPERLKSSLRRPKAHQKRPKGAQEPHIDSFLSLLSPFPPRETRKTEDKREEKREEREVEERREKREERRDKREERREKIRDKREERR